MSTPTADRRRVAIVGGGPAGLAAAAVALSGTNCRVQLFERDDGWGGRATSFREPASGELVDLCQHVSMRCCTNLADLARRTGIEAAFQSAPVLHFMGPDGRQCDLQASRWLPAPLHLAPSLRRLSYLTAGDRRQIARALWRLLRTHFADSPAGPTAAEWLRSQGQPPRAIEWFWSVVLVSALGESLERASMAAARKVFLDGFLSTRDSYVVEVPQAPLGQLFGERVPAWLERQGVEILSGTAVKQVSRGAHSTLRLTSASFEPQEFDRVIVAAPWHQLPGLLAGDLHVDRTWLEELSSWEAAPITGVHLWFDRPITSLPHAVLVGRLGQWLFNRSGAAAPDAADGSNEFYYQVVISALRDLAGRDRDALVEELCGELRAIWPKAAPARLLRSRVVTENSAVFSVRPGSERLRPAQRTSVEGLFLAGDWTATGWPATMEGAVRSGYLAAEAVTASLGSPEGFLAADLPRSWLTRWLAKR